MNAPTHHQVHSTGAGRAGMYLIIAAVVVGIILAFIFLFPSDNSVKPANATPVAVEQPLPVTPPSEIPGLSTTTVTPPPGVIPPIPPPIPVMPPPPQKLELGDAPRLPSAPPQTNQGARATQP